MKNSAEIIDTNVTDKWGVHWSEMETVRDFLQNFYDANKISDINISIDRNTVNVFAPAIFDPNELIYLGSGKLGDTIQSDSMEKDLKPVY